MFSLSSEQPIYDIDAFSNLQRRGPDASDMQILELPGGNAGYFHHQGVAILGLNEKYNQSIADLNLSISKIYEQSFSFDDLITTIHAQEHPFVSMSVVAQNKIYSEVAKSGFKVCLDGQGADEIICGYRGYPHFLSNAVNAHEQGFDQYQKSIPLKKQLQLTTQRFLSKRSMSLIRYYVYSFLGRFDDTFLKGKVSKGDSVIVGDIQDINKECLQNISDVLQRQGLQSLLRHGDRNSMYWGVESRVPFLNNEFVQTAVSISPFLQSPTYGQTKALFKQAMRGITPDFILDRTDKIGFKTSSLNFLL